MANPTGINQYTRGAGGAEKASERARVDSRLAVLGSRHASGSKNQVDHLEAARRHDVAGRSNREAAAQYPHGSGHREGHNDTAREHEAQARFHAGVAQAQKNDSAVQQRTAPGNVPGPSMNERFGAPSGGAHPAAGTEHAAHYNQDKAQKLGRAMRLAAQAETMSDHSEAAKAYREAGHRGAAERHEKIASEMRRRSR